MSPSVHQPLLQGGTERITAGLSLNQGVACMAGVALQARGNRSIASIARYLRIAKSAFLGLLLRRRRQQAVQAEITCGRAVVVGEIIGEGNHRRGASRLAPAEECQFLT
jgi:hypothetical protein